MLTSKRECTGCGACSLACKNNAINMEADTEGCLYPNIDLNKCVNCGLCDKVCHIQSYQSSNHADPSVYAAYLKKTAELTDVSSGGVFTALSERVIEDGGVVYGVVHNSLFDVRHVRADSITQILPLKRSKYLESNTDRVFDEVLNDLKNGINVLFSGTPCQIAALNTFLCRRYDNITTCEVVCHGVPIWNAFKNYIKEVQAIHGHHVISINYRDKSDGWNQNKIKLTFDDGSEISEKSNMNKLHYGYCLGLFYRPSCSLCKYATLPRAADITLADYWLYDGVLRKDNNNRGISLVLCNNEKGKYLFDTCKDKLVFANSDLKSALKSSHHLTHRPKSSRYRDSFVREMAFGFSAAYEKFTLKMRRDRFVFRVIAMPYLLVRKLISTIRG